MNNAALPIYVVSLTLIGFWTPASSAAEATDPFIGKWKLNTSESTIADQMTIQAVGGNKYGLTFSGAGQPEIVAADGTDQPGLNDTMLSITVEDAKNWKIVRKKEGRTVVAAIWKLADDGKTLSDAFTSSRPDGSSSTINMLYKRAAGESGIPGTWETTDVKLEGVHELDVRSYDGDGLSFISSDAPGSPKNVKFDGKEHGDGQGGPTSGTVYVGRRIDERSLEYATKIDGKTVQTRQVTLSPDHKKLTIVVHLADQRLPNTLVFDRE